MTLLAVRVPMSTLLLGCLNGTWKGFEGANPDTVEGDPTKIEMS